MSHKIKERLLAVGLSQRKLAKILGVVPGTVGNWMAGKQSPNKKLLPKVAVTLKTTTNYLLGETNDPTPRPPIEPDEIAHSTRADIRRIETHLEEIKELLSNPGNAHKNNIIPLRKKRPYFVPLVAWPIGAGTKGLFEEIMESDPGRRVSVEAPEHVDAAVIVAGDSMSPEIPDGSIVLVRRIHPENNDVGICFLKDFCEWTLREIFLQPESEGTGFIGLKSRKTGKTQWYRPDQVLCQGKVVDRVNDPEKIREILEGE